MFNFVVNYLGFLKYVPGLGLLFDSWLKLSTLLINPDLLDHMDNIRHEVSKWEGVDIGLHKYGGMQFNYRTREIGHIHGNGLLDMLLSWQLKKQLIIEGKVLDHHVFKHTGWVSFYIKTEADKNYALELLKLGYKLKNRSISPGRDHQTTLPAVITVLT